MVAEDIALTDDIVLLAKSMEPEVEIEDISELV